MNRGSWHPPLRGRDVILVVTVHVTVWLLPLVVFVFPAVTAAHLGLAGVLISVAASVSTMRIGYLVAQRVASRCIQASLLRALRGESW